jgi:hypothetical protein
MVSSKQLVLSYGKIYDKMFGTHKNENIPNDWNIGILYYDA